MPAWPLADLSVRRRGDEWMDQPGLDPAEHARALKGLGRINRLSQSAAIVWPPLFRLARATRGEPIRVLDLASGGGDVPIALAARASRARLNIEITGSDVSPVAVQFAREKAASRRAMVEFVELDALREAIPGGYDVVMCSLFLHHLEPDAATMLLSKMRGVARRLALVNDLVRSRAGYVLAWTGCRLLSRSPIVRHDGPLSVRGAYTIPEVRELSARAGMDGADVSPAWPCRFLLSWNR